MAQIIGSKGPLLKPTTAAHPGRELVFMPHFGHCPNLVEEFGRKENGHST